MLIRWETGVFFIGIILDIVIPIVMYVFGPRLIDPQFLPQATYIGVFANAVAIVAIPIASLMLRWKQITLGSWLLGSAALLITVLISCAFARDIIRNFSSEWSFAAASIGWPLAYVFLWLALGIFLGFLLAIAMRVIKE